MAGKRISQIAKELGIESKAIITKCRDEGISETIVKGHMSTVSIGLEMSIKEWFSNAASAGGTAVEQTAHVDLEKVKTKKPATKKK